MQFSKPMRNEKYFGLSGLLVLVGCAGGGAPTASPVAPVTFVSNSYLQNVETKLYSNGSTVTTTATSAPVTWAGDHITKTTTYTFADATTNPVVAVVPGTIGAASYSTNTQTIVTSYGDGTTSTASNTATSAPITWASDHITKTTTYTFADATTNPVVVTVAPVLSTPVLTAAVYSPSWETGGAVTPPSVSSVVYTYGDGTYGATTEAGTLSLPFAQATLVAQSITDPSAVVRSTTTDYNLIWGAPDPQGPYFASLFPSASSRLPFNLSYMGKTYTGPAGEIGPTLNQPAPDVLAAWNAGWTGKGVNVLLVDYYGSQGGWPYHNTHSCCAETAMMITDLIAHGASKFGFNASGAGYPTDMHGINLTQPTPINVVSASWGTNWFTSANLNVHVAPTPTQITDYYLNNNGIQDSINWWTGFFSGTNTITNLTGIGNAVIVKSAGDDGIDTKYEQFVKSYANSSSIQPRLLIVGALDKNGTIGSPATIAYYSNTAGEPGAIANRFVVANGKAPWISGGVGGNYYGGDNELNSGTHYAAAVVAGYAAIVMQKFPNLDAVKTSSIILDTARYDTLACNPNCNTAINTAIYGMGEASLSRALAPVGRLR